jgi:hypothetical protein
LAVDEKLIGLHVALPSRQGDDVRFVDVRSHGFVESKKPGRCGVLGSSRFVATKSPKGRIIILFDLSVILVIAPLLGCDSRASARGCGQVFWAPR